MATREENIKKINEELEKLDDEQLEQVAGGFYIPEWRPRKNLVASGNTNTDQASLIPTLDDDNLLVAKSKII